MKRRVARRRAALFSPEPLFGLRRPDRAAAYLSTIYETNPVPAPTRARHDPDMNRFPNAREAGSIRRPAGRHLLSPRLFDQIEARPAKFLHAAKKKKPPGRPSPVSASAGPYASDRQAGFELPLNLGEKGFERLG